MVMGRNALFVSARELFAGEGKWNMPKCTVSFGDGKSRCRIW